VGVHAIVLEQHITRIVFSMGVQGICVVNDTVEEVSP
jgi:hypothetical protein